MMHAPIGGGAVTSPHAQISDTALLAVLSTLHTKDLIACTHVCRGWARVVRDHSDQLWSKQLAAWYGGTLPPTLSQDVAKGDLSPLELLRSSVGAARALSARCHRNDPTLLLVRLRGFDRSAMPEDAEWRRALDAQVALRQGNPGGAPQYGAATGPSGAWERAYRIYGIYVYEEVSNRVARSMSERRRGGKGGLKHEKDLEKYPPIDEVVPVSKQRCVGRLIEDGAGEEGVAVFWSSEQERSSLVAKATEWAQAVRSAPGTAVAAPSRVLPWPFPARNAAPRLLAPPVGGIFAGGRLAFRHVPTNMGTEFHMSVDRGGSHDYSDYDMW